MTDGGLLVVLFFSGVSVSPCMHTPFSDFILDGVFLYLFPYSVQFSSVAQSCPTVCDPMNRSTPGLPVHQQLPESTQTHVHWTGDAIQPSHPLSSPSPPAPNLSQHQGLFQWVSSSHQVAKVSWMLSFKPTFSCSSFTFIKRLFSSSLSAIKVVVICISEVIDSSPGNLDSSLCFFQPSISHDVLCI